MDCGLHLQSYPLTRRPHLFWLRLRRAVFSALNTASALAQRRTVLSGWDFPDFHPLKTPLSNDFPEGDGDPSRCKLFVYALQYEEFLIELS